MGEVIEFGRVGTGRGGIRNCSDDVYISKVGRTHGSRKNSMGVSIRLTRDAIKRQRWMVGDYVTASVSFDDAGALRSVSISRVSGSGNGCKISGNGKGNNSGWIRFTAPDEAIEKIFPRDVIGYGASIESDVDGPAICKVVRVITADNDEIALG